MIYSKEEIKKEAAEFIRRLKDGSISRETLPEKDTGSYYPEKEKRDSQSVCDLNENDLIFHALNRNHDNSLNNQKNRAKPNNAELSK